VISTPLPSIGQRENARDTIIDGVSALGNSRRMVWPELTI